MTRRNGSVVMTAALLASCSLAFPYDDYELAGGDASIDHAATGGHSGVIGDAKFGNGGTAGDDASSGGTGAATSGGAAGTISNGGSAGTAANGGSGGTGGTSGGDASSGGGAAGAGGTGGSFNPCAGQSDNTPCGAAPICNNTSLIHWKCLSGICTSASDDCSPYLCKNASCPTSCAVEGECAAPTHCVSGACIDCAVCSDRLFGSATSDCPGNTPTLWSNLRTCCGVNCSVECPDMVVCNGVNPPNSPCFSCLIGNGCSTQYNACIADLPD